MVGLGGSGSGRVQGITAAVAQHTLQSLNTAGLHNEAPSPTEMCVCVCVYSKAACLPLLGGRRETKKTQNVI